MVVVVVVMVIPLLLATFRCILSRGASAQGRALPSSRRGSRSQPGPLPWLRGHCRHGCCPRGCCVQQWKCCWCDLRPTRLFLFNMISLHFGLNSNWNCKVWFGLIQSFAKSGSVRFGSVRFGSAWSSTVRLEPYSSLTLLSEIVLKKLAFLGCKGQGW